MKSHLKSLVIAVSMIATMAVTISCTTIEQNTSALYHKNKALTPVHPELVEGVLENGLKYAILPNQFPENTVELRLIVNAGSFSDPENKEGLAHYLEHMAFNGSKNFPGNSVIDELEKIGISWGQHNNAWTSFDYTGYQLSSPADDDSLKLSFTVLRDVADGLNLNADQWQGEKGVIQAERRARSLTQGQRIWQQVVNHEYPASPYTRPVVGTEESIDSLTVEDARLFYKQWYQPDNMLLLVSGSRSVEDISRFLQQYFSDLSGVSKQQVVHETVYQPATRLNVLTDIEPLGENSHIYFRLRDQKLQTRNLKSLKQTWLESLALSMFNKRLAKLKEAHPLVFKHVWSAKDYRLDGTENLMLGVESFEGQLVESSELTYSSYLQAVKFGFTEAELEAKRRESLSGVESYLQGKERIKSSGWVRSMISFYQNDYALLSPDQYASQYRRFLTEISLEDVNTLLSDRLNPGNGRPNIKATTDTQVNDAGNQRVARKIDQTILAIDNDSLSPWNQNSNVEQIFDFSLSGQGKVISEEVNEKLETTLWTLDNGIRVYLRPDTLNPGKISVTGMRAGGLGQLNEQGSINANNMLWVKWRSPIAGIPASDFKAYLNKENISISQKIRTDYTMIDGVATKKKLDLILKSFHLLFTESNFTEDQVEAGRRWILENAEKNKQRPGKVFNVELNRLLYQNHWSYQPWDKESVALLNADNMANQYRSFFQNGSEYQFFVTGDFNIEDIREQLVKGLTALPVENYNGSMVDSGARHIKGRHQFIRETGRENTSKLTLRFYSENYDNSLEQRRIWSQMKLLLKTRLERRIREELAASYTVTVSGNSNKLGQPYLVTDIVVESEPERVKEVEHAVLAEVARLKSELSDSEEIDTLRERGLRFLAETIQTTWYGYELISDHYFWQLDQDVLLARDQFLNNFTAEELQQAANDWLFKPSI